MTDSGERFEWTSWHNNNEEIWLFRWSPTLKGPSGLREEEESSLLALPKAPAGLETSGAPDGRGSGEAAEEGHFLRWFPAENAVACTSAAH